MKSILHPRSLAILAALALAAPATAQTLTGAASARAARIASDLGCRIDFIG